MRISSYLIIVSISFALAACGGNRSLNGDAIVVEEVSGWLGSGLDAGDISTTGLDSDNSLDGLGIHDPNILNQRVLYFDYDSSILTGDSEAIIQANAMYLKTVPNVQIVLEGHTDERGTREYNLALGEDRAKAVSRVMHTLGIRVNRIQTISYGEERPASLGSTTDAWMLNRRVEILYP